MKARQNILIVDDDRFFSQLARRLAAGTGHILEECNDPTRLNLLKLASYDLIILDIMMPGIDGVQIINRIRQYAPATAVVLMTSLDQSVIDSITGLAVELGVRIHGVLHKPFKASDLLALIESNGKLPKRPAIAAALGRNLRGDSPSILLLQPQVSLSTGKWLGCEAVANHTASTPGRAPQYGRGTAHGDDSAQVVERELALLDKAMQGMQELIPHAGCLLSLSINIPAQAMLKQDFADLLIQKMRQREFPGSHLVINLSESDYLEESDALQENINRLRQENIRFSIKYSSADKAAVEYSDYPGYDEFKLDRSVVANLRNNQSDRDLVKLLLDRGTRLCIPTVAEGIADMESYKWLCAHGCDIGQGPLICGLQDVAGLIKWHQSLVSGTRQQLGLAKGVPLPGQA